MRLHLRIAEHDDAVRVEIVERARRAEALDVFRRAIGVEADREQLALDCRSGWVGLRVLIATSASRIDRSRSSSVTISEMRISG